MPAQFQLVMRSGPTPGTVYPLEGDLITVGRDSGNSIAINDAEMSRRHARLLFQGGKYVLEDVGSTNGTFVNGQRLGGPHVLKPGDIVSFGEQISLGFEAVAFDPAATIASPRQAVGPGRVLPPAPPPAAPVAGYTPAGPEYLPPAQKSNTTKIILIILAVILFLCLCGFSIYLYFAPEEFYCATVPFLFPGACP